MKWAFCLPPCAARRKRKTQPTNWIRMDQHQPQQRIAPDMAPTCLTLQHFPFPRRISPSSAEDAMTKVMASFLILPENLEGVYFVSPLFERICLNKKQLNKNFAMASDAIRQNAGYFLRIIADVLKFDPKISTDCAMERRIRRDRAGGNFPELFCANLQKWQAGRRGRLWPLRPVLRLLPAAQRLLRHGEGPGQGLHH